MPNVAEIRSQRPREVVVARALAIVATVLWIPLAGLSMPSGAVVGIAMILYVHGAFGAAKGRNGARIETTVALVVIYFFLLPYIWRGFAGDLPTGPQFATLDIVAALVAAVGIALLYVPRSNGYFRAVGLARRTDGL
jgi:hypothetical protein